MAVGMCMVIYMTKHLEATRTALLEEVRTRVLELGEDCDTVVAELKTRPEWDLVAKAQGLR